MDTVSIQHHETKTDNINDKTLDMRASVLEKHRFSLRYFGSSPIHSVD